MTTPRTPDLDAIRARNEERKRIKEAASSGPWKRDDGDDILDEDGSSIFYAECGDHGPIGVTVGRTDDAIFIAHARNDTVEADVDALLAEVERLQGEDDSARREREAILVALREQMEDGSMPLEDVVAMIEARGEPPAKHPPTPETT